MTDTLTLSAHARRAFGRLATDLGRVFGVRLVALVSSGPRSSVAFASAVSPGDLEALGALVETWHRDGLDTPLVLTPDEFRRSLDAFPLEYQAIADRHVVIHGTPPFDDLTVNRDHLRRACEIQAKGHLLHLRQGCIDAGGHRDQIAMLVAGSAGRLRALLANIARLEAGAPAPDALAGAALAGVPDDLVRDILALEQSPEQAASLVPRFGDYLHLAESLWTFVDRWR